MSKKRKFKMCYSIIVNGEEFPKEYTIEGVHNADEAKAKLHKLCKCEITISSVEPL